MKLLYRENIDTDKWDARVRSSATENIFCYAWYLDAVAENWAAVITEDYQTIVPLPFTKRLGVRQVYNAPFCREYSIIGNEFSWTEVLDLIKDNFSGADFRSSIPELTDGSVERKHQFIELDDNWRTNYRTNAKRILKKAEKNYSVNEGQDVEILLNLFRQYVMDKIESIKEADLQKLTQLMNTALERGQGKLLTASDHNEVVAAGFFLLDKKRVIYLKGASTDEAKKDGAMYVLMDRAMDLFHEDFDTFDFGGSDVENVANFYKKFGAEDRSYYHYTINELPLWFKTIKRLKK